MSGKNFRRISTLAAAKVLLLVLLAILLGPQAFHTSVLATGGGGGGGDDEDPPIPDPPTHALYVGVAGYGYVGVSNPSTVVYDSGLFHYTSPQSVELTAVAAEGWRFDRWDETGSTNPSITVAVSNYVERKAGFIPIPPSEEPDNWVKLRTSVLPEEAMAAGCSVSPEGRTKHAVGSEVPLKPQGADGWTFTGWDGPDAEDIDTSKEPHVIVMNSDKKVKAVFSQQFKLKTSTKGKGTVTPDPPGPLYGAETTVVVTAEPNADQSWSFVEWRKDASGTDSSTDVVMDSDKHAKAVFTRASKKSLTVTTPEGCKIRIEADPNGTSDGSNPTEPGTTILQFTSTSEVTLRARVYSEFRGQGYRFVRWEGDVPAGQESSNPVTITVDSDKSVEAVLEETFRLKVESEGPGSVDIDAPAGSQVGDNRYVAGTEIGLSATPSESFVEWEGSIGGTDSETTVTLDSDKYVLAKFFPGIGDEPLVDVYFASFKPNSASSHAIVYLAPLGLSGMLTVTLLGPDSSYQFLNETRPSGNHTAYCATASIPPGTYDTVRARWFVSGDSYYDDYEIELLTISDEADDDPNAQPDDDDDSDSVSDQADEEQESDEDSSTSEQENNEADPLLLHSGEFKLREVDLRLKGRGMDLVWARTYRSKIPSSTYLGKNWDFSYNIYLKRMAQDVILLHDGSRARRDKFYHVGNGLYERDGFFGHLQENPDGSYTLHFADGSKWHFAPITPPLVGSSPEIGKIMQMEDRNGNSITFDYDVVKNLESITDTMGRTTHLDYWNNRIARIRCGSREVEYSYFATGDSGGPHGDLKSVRSPLVLTGLSGHDFPEGKIRTYTYSKGFSDDARNHNLLTITDGEGVTYLQNFYSSETDPEAFSYDRVVQQVWGRVTDGIDNDTVNLVYVENPVPPAGAPGVLAAVKTIVNDRNGHVTEYYYDSDNHTLLAREFTGVADPLTATTETQNRPTSKLRPTDPDYFDTRMVYNAQGLTTSVTYPNGNSVSYGYDSGSRIKEGNLLSVTYSTGEILSFEYLNGFGSRNLRDFVTRAVDANENVTKHFYDANGNRTRTERWNAAETQLLAQHDYTYNVAGQLTSHTLPSNGTTRRVDAFVYEGGDGYLNEIIVDSGGADLETVLVRGDYGEILQKTDPYGNVTEFVVNDLDQVVRASTHVKNVYDETRTYQTDYYFDGANRLSQVIRQDEVNLSDAVSLVLTHDELGNVLSETRYKGGYSGGSWLDPVTTTLEYDDNRNLIGVVSPEGRETRFVYDERDILYERQDGYGSPDLRVTRFAYDGNGNLVDVVAGPGPDQRAYSYTYDSLSRLKTIGDPLSRTIEYVYDDNGNVVMVQGRDSGDDVVLESTGVYDPLNRLTAVQEKIFDLGTAPPTQIGVALTTIEYNPDSSIAEVTNPNDHTIAIEYDSAGRRASVTDELGNSTSYTYSQQAGVQVITETRLERSELAGMQSPGSADQTLQTERHLDGLMRPIKVVEKRTQSFDLVTKLTYDSRGNRTHFTDAANVASIHSFDGLNRLVESELPQGVTVTRTWDDDSLLLSELDGLSRATAYTYDALGRLRQLTTADSENYSYEYNAFDEVIAVTDANGSEIDLIRDDLGRVTERSVNPATGVSAPAVPEVFSYDALSNLVYAENDDAIVERAFDSRGFPLEESLTFNADSASYTTTSAYDVAGNLTNITYPGGRTVSHTLDALERIKTVSSNQGGMLATYRYIGQGTRVERRLNGDWSWMDFAFDDLGRTVGSTLRKLDGLAQIVLDSRSYGWDALHNRTGRADTRADGPETDFTYQYDGLSRLAQTVRTPGTGDPVTHQYALDAAGNRDSVTVTVGQETPTVAEYDFQGDDALVNAYTVTPFDTARTHDANGNLTLRTLSLNSEVAFVYDYRDLMVSHSQTNPAQTVQYKYDALGRRIEKTVGEDSTRYIYHGARVIEERDGAGALLGSYVYGNYLDEVLTLRRGTADYFLHSDDQWNTVALTDNTEDVVERYEYGDYGQPEFYDAAGTPLPGSTVGNPCLFTGQRYDAETGLYWYKSRYFDPETGRFTTRDPLGLWGDPLNLGNPYIYAGNNPWTYVDPFGLCSEDGEDDEDSLWDRMRDRWNDWWDWANTPSEDNDARDLFPGSEVEMRDWDDVKDMNADVDNLDLDSKFDPRARAAFGNLKEVLYQARYAALRDGTIAAGTGAFFKGLGSFGDEFAGPTFLYQKVGPNGDHLKFGVTANPGTRYTAEQLGGGRLRIVASGRKSDMLALERRLHETLPLGPEERQAIYIRIQASKGYRIPPYDE